MSAQSHAHAAPERPFVLKPETVAEIERVIPLYPVKRSAVLPVLHRVQADFGHIPNEAVAWVAHKLDLQPINVLEVVTFYPFFRQHPIGRRHVRVCRTLPCALRGAYATCETLLKEFDTKLGAISPCGEVTIEFAECLASCGTAPVVLVDEILHENIDVEAAKKLANLLKSEAKKHA